MAVVEEFLRANRAFVAQSPPRSLPSPPKRRVAIVTCMDGRMDPAKFLGLKEGDAHVIRNAGGRADADVIRSLVISQQMLGTREVVVIHHTDCGMANFTNDQMRARLKVELGKDADGLDFMPFTCPEQSVCEDITTLRNCPLIPEEVPIHGFIYDVFSGELRPVCVP